MDFGVFIPLSFLHSAVITIQICAFPIDNVLKVINSNKLRYHMDFKKRTIHQTCRYNYRVFDLIFLNRQTAICLLCTAWADIRTKANTNRYITIRISVISHFPVPIALITLLLLLSDASYVDFATFANHTKQVRLAVYLA